MVDASNITIRASSIPGYIDCPRRFAARTIRREIEANTGVTLRQLPAGIGAAVGTSTHSGATYMLQSKMDTGDLGNVSEADDRAMASFREEISSGVMYDAATTNPNAAEKQIIRQVKAYRKYIAPDLDPIAVEKRLKVKRASGVIVSGQLDNMSDATVHDLKTGVRQRVNIAQYGTYSMLWRAHGHPVRAIVEDYVPRAAITKPQPRPIITAYSIEVAEQEAESILRRMEQDLISFRETGYLGTFMSNPSSMLCSDRYCPAWGTGACFVWKDTTLDVEAPPPLDAT